ncbi:hypothetical protein [Methylobacter sp. YRD-M1]
MGSGKTTLLNHLLKQAPQSGNRYIKFPIPYPALTAQTCP